MSRRSRKKRNSQIVAIVFFIISIIAINYYIYIKYPLICIDAGHGGKDVGSILENERYEKDDNLEIALKVKSELKKQGFRVIMTRKNDIFVSLEKRCKIANLFKARVFVSIHRNSAKSGNGVEIWVSQNDVEGNILAENISNCLDNTKIQANRGVKEGSIESNEKDYFVNKNTNMMSCLIELGFISNRKDNQLLDENIDEYAKAIAKGIADSLKLQFTAKLKKS